MTENKTSLLESIRNTMLNNGLYHALYKASEIIGGETWGDNTDNHTINVLQVSEDNRKSDVFNILLLGSATPTSIEQILKAIDYWEKENIIKNGKLTLVDVNSTGFDRLNPDFKKRVTFIKMDVREMGDTLKDYYDFITSDYLLNFIPKEQLSVTIKGLGKLLKKGGVFDATVDTRKCSSLGKILGTVFVRNGITEQQLNESLDNGLILITTLQARSRMVAKLSEIGADRIVWGFRKN